MCDCYEPLSHLLCQSTISRWCLHEKDADRWCDSISTNQFWALLTITSQFCVQVWTYFIRISSHAIHRSKFLLTTSFMSLFSHNFHRVIYEFWRSLTKLFQVGWCEVSSPLVSRGDHNNRPWATKRQVFASSQPLASRVAKQTPCMKPLLKQCGQPTEMHKVALTLAQSEHAPLGQAEQKQKNPYMNQTRPRLMEYDQTRTNSNATSNFFLLVGSPSVRFPPIFLFAAFSKTKIER